MNRGKRYGLMGRFHSYHHQEKDCTKNNCGERRDYAVRQSLQRRRERSDIVRRTLSGRKNYHPRYCVIKYD